MVARILLCRRMGYDCNHVSEIHVVRPIYMIVAMDIIVPYARSDCVYVDGVHVVRLIYPALGYYFVVGLGLTGSKSVMRML